MALFFISFCASYALSRLTLSQRTLSHELMNNRNAQNPSLYFLSLNLSHQKPITPNPISVKSIHLLLSSFNTERAKKPKSHLCKMAEEEELYGPKWKKWMTKNSCRN
ncbi:hypothetical protein AMTRI_Chr09g42140 [Amborella trichopoda]